MSERDLDFDFGASYEEPLRGLIQRINAGVTPASESPDLTQFFDVLERVEDMGDGTVRESWARVYRDYECDLWYVIRPAARRPSPEQEGERP